MNTGRRGALTGLIAATVLAAVFVRGGTAKKVSETDVSFHVSCQTAGIGGPSFGLTIPSATTFTSDTDMALQNGNMTIYATGICRMTAHGSGTRLGGVERIPYAPGDPQRFYETTVLGRTVHVLFPYGDDECYELTLRESAFSPEAMEAVISSFSLQPEPNGLPDVQLTMALNDPDSPATVEANWENGTSLPLLAGRTFSLEQLQGGEVVDAPHDEDGPHYTERQICRGGRWVPVEPVGGVAVEDVADTVPAHETRPWLIPLAAHYGTLAVGNYRIVASYQWQEKTYSETAEFYICRQVPIPGGVSYENPALTEALDSST